MIVGRFYTARMFDDVESTVAFLRDVTLHRGLSFDRYKLREPDAASHHLDDLTEPAKVLCGYPVHTDGGVVLEGDTHAVSFDIAFHVSGLDEWVFTAEDNLFDDPDRIDTLVEYFTEVCVGNNVLFAGVDHEDVWERVVGQAGGSSDIRDVLRLDYRLPDVYWFSYFGAGIFEELESDAVVADIDLLESEAQLEGAAVSLGESPLDVDRNKQEATAIREELGEAFFVAGTGEEREEIAALETIQEVLNERAACESIIPYLPPKTTATFERDIRSVDGEVFVDPEELAEVLVVYLHGNVEEVFGYDGRALDALDEYFRTAPQRWLYTANHLENELIPALGAYLGEVFTRELPVSWTGGATVMNRTLTAPQLAPKEVSPYHLAHHVVYHDMEIVDFFECLRECL